MSSARDLSNLTLAHEIIVNRDFHVEQPHLPQNRYLPAQNGRPVNMAITWATQMPIDNWWYSILLFSLEKQVKDIVHKAFWDSLESELNDDPPEYEHAIKLLEEIREVSFGPFPLYQTWLIHGWKAYLFRKMTLLEDFENVSFLTPWAVITDLTQVDKQQLCSGIHSFTCPVVYVLWMYARRMYLKWANSF